ncbi:hypothetical protein CAPTEDRAFT_150941 [Capitella teleta]|uniref:Small ribosomal subunit protein uS7 domain-containing protein n=1 Tax=Capitella teleta TaxID=283909 RepID=R7TS92_CAPTE|nr:hypothetical protein CAPTEDRAFT_150941 [Capitella teleta]|eukprot:ELT96472.1 hypothetical protein CAPTEDRAFT_150941 [Capitella teleta]
MAASMTKGVLNCCRIICQNSKSSASIYKASSPIWQVPLRNSSYSSTYLEPTYRKADLDQPLDASDDRRFLPIKAAKNDEVSTSTLDPLLNKFIRQMMRKGNKQISRLVMDRTIERIKQFQLEKYHKETSEEKRDLINLEPISIIYQAVENCKPLLTIQHARRGGVMYMVPIPVKPSYALYKSIDWIIEASTGKHRTNTDNRVWDDMAREFIAAAKNDGGAIRKKQELHRLCEANRAYAHYRW